jgi:hypothetical protein
MKNNSSRDKIYKKNNRIDLDKLQNKYTNCKGIKYNTNSEKIYWNTRETGYNM